MFRNFVAASAVATAVTSPLNIDAEFDQFVTTFGKNYGPEKEARKAVFAANLKKIEEQNAKNNGYTLGITPFADLTSSEFVQQHTGLIRPNLTSMILDTHVYSGADLPDTVDWVKRGAVTPVKNQGRCGSCWAFSSTGALEGAWKIKTGKLVSISEQQLVDCAKYRYGNLACSGGLQPHAFNYIESHAMCTETDYPYIGKNWLLTRCKADECKTAGVPQGALASYTMVAHSEQALMEAVAQQPVAVSIEADQDVFHLYKGGIVQGSACGQTLDHAVLAVGYGTDNGKKYWTVKNSWTTKWGENGYVRIIRGTDECGILNGPPLYPVVKAGEASILV